MSEEEEMQIDNYTKFIMTVIAGALLVIALKGTGIIPPANAHSGGVHKIAICDSNGSRCAEVDKMYRLRITKWFKQSSSGYTHEP